HPVRSLAECRPYPGRFASFSRERGIDIRVNAKNLIEARNLKNRFHIFLQTGERELAPVFFNLLHRFDQNGQAGAIDVADVAHVDDEISDLNVAHTLDVLLHSRESAESTSG